MCETQVHTKLSQTQSLEHRHAWSDNSSGAQDAGDSTVMLVLVLEVYMEQLRS